MLQRKQNSDRRNNFNELEDGAQLVGLMKNKEVGVGRGDRGGEFRERTRKQIMDRDRLLL